MSPSLLLPCEEVAWEEPIPRGSSFWRGLGVGGPWESQNVWENQDSPVTRTESDHQKGLGVLLDGKTAALDTSSTSNISPMPYLGYLPCHT